MTRTFHCGDMEVLFLDTDIRRFRNIERVARRKLMYLHHAQNLNDLRSPPDNRLEMLKGNRKGQYSIRINAQWRLCFNWNDNDAFDVEIIDYH